MIAIDTNVLLRYLLDDDPGQSPRASALLRRHKSVLLTDVVLAETVWTLRGARYGLDNQGISDVLDALFAEPGIFFEDNEVVWKAAADFAGGSNAALGTGRARGGARVDFADALIINKARSCARKSGQPFHGVYTFDAAALAIRGTKKP